MNSNDICRLMRLQRVRLERRPYTYLRFKRIRISLHRTWAGPPDGEWTSTTIPVRRQYTTARALIGRVWSRRASNRQSRRVHIDVSIFGIKTKTTRPDEYRITDRFQSESTRFEYARKSTPIAWELITSTRRMTNGALGEDLKLPAINEIFKSR